MSQTDNKPSGRSETSGGGNARVGFRAPHHLWLGAAFYLTALISGISDVSDPETVTNADRLLNLAIPMVMGAWVIADAAARARPLPLLSYSWAIIFAWVVVPWYAISSRGWRGAGWLMIHAICYLGIYLLTSIAFDTILYDWSEP